ncbi:HAD family hydrolase [Luteolibacter sp. GHJ8]|uniref:HAD family hydrolase n=1 Tax=Luteolibacter rhizosphaerae TaxID=2989719 RepID=A0ABT3G1E3_9BACT|nr:HAD family hydrolase [Luteolibacter rhizosphaerae]MCW1913654.1 HAD family hydrolase [Luteolibacter rhizosphaerae]
MEVRRSFPWLLISDVDDTLLGDAGGLDAFSRECIGVLLVLNSSRPAASVEKTFADISSGPELAGRITGMGTEVEIGGRKRSDWQEMFEGWERAPVDRLMKRMGFPAHAAEMQTAFKASFAVPRSRWTEVRKAVLAGSPGSKVICSGEGDFDVIPAAAGKDRAALWVAGELGIPASRWGVAGDSANDLAVFHAAPRAIAVGNARQELLRNADPAKTYHATRSHAWGLIEGLRRWGALAPDLTENHGNEN